MPESMGYVPPSERRGPPPLPPEIRKGPPPLPEAVFKSPERHTPPPIPENTREIRSVSDSIRTGEKEQRLPELYLSTENSETGTEISLALKKGEKREKSDRGEDALFFDPDTGLGGIADGLGGEGKEGSGAIASEMATKLIPQAYKKIKKEWDLKEITRDDIISFITDQLDGEGITPQNPLYHQRLSRSLSEIAALPEEVLRESIVLQKSIELIHKRIREGKETDGSTTLSLGKTLVLEDGRRIEVYAQVGDGRITKVRADGSTVDCLKEHSLANILRARGMNVDDPNFTIQLSGKTYTKQQIETQMTHAVGGKTNEFARPFVGARVMQEGETMLYYSDGLADVEEATKKFGTVVKDENPRRKARTLIDRVVEKDFKNDDKAVLAKTFGSSPDRAESVTVAA